jgi:benzoyl-CoA reductase/2-hydroxyglutaryl-CoA dehydratase subunit BcrC/BadD/HgdB
MSALHDLAQAYTDRYAAARAFRAEGGQVVGYIGADAPEELIMAAGLLPVRLAAETGASDAPADRYGEGGGNATIRAYVARLLDGTYAEIDHLVIGTTPSYLGALFTFLREIQQQDADFPRISLQLFDFHHGSSAATAAFNLDSVRRLAATLEGWAGRPITEAGLRDAIAACNASRDLLGRLQTLRRQRRASGVEALNLIGSAYVAPKAWHNARLEAALGELAALPPLPGRAVVFSGSETETTDLYARIEAQGLLIVADDQGWGSRVAERPVDVSGEPLAAIAARYHHMAPAPAKASTGARVAYLSELCQRSGAEAVVFAARGLDHPAAWDIPAQVAALATDGVRNVVLEPAAFAHGDLGAALDPLGLEPAHG